MHIAGGFNEMAYRVVEFDIGIRLTKSGIKQLGKRIEEDVINKSAVRVG
jgi:hypothetical protein